MIDEKIQNILSELSISVELARAILEKSNGDVKLAIELYKNSEIAECLVFEGEFNSIIRKVNGIFLIIIDKKEFHFVKMEVFTAIKEKVKGDRVSTNSFIRSVYYYKYESEVEESQDSENVSRKFFESLNEEKICYLVKKYDKKEYADICEEFKMMLNYAIDDIVELDLRVKYDADILEKKVVERDNLVQAIPVVDIYNGVEAMNLSVSDFIFIKLKSNEGQQKKIIEGLQNVSAEGVAIRKIKEKWLLRESTFGAQEYSIIVGLNKSIDAVLYVSGRVKVKIYNPEIDKKVLEKKRNLIEEEKEKSDEELLELKSSKRLGMLMYFFIIIFIFFFVFIFYLIQGI